MEALTKRDRLPAVAAAAGHDLNDELTVILSGVTESIRAVGPGHPVQPLLVALRAAAQRCAWKASALVNFGATRGARPAAAPLETVLGSPATWDCLDPQD